ncbi:hypothetical protein BDY21DRAFT_337915 [Lineolata rhizophorae]|uniref:Uncharacterized protein n=1 Tax=Lineolata rhizophorae TaxID=578093 RepID=A0A6A6P605_9PEZI|nr:hypothetical protein BDY21DRAFT_337915 [Lineolata rhizophorae]
MPSLNELETAAADVLNILKGIPEFSNARVAVIGGLALWKYIPTGRTTEDVDFIINMDSAPHGIKQKLLTLPNSPFVQLAQVFFYKIPGGPNVQLDITPEWQSPYMPAAAVKLKDIAANAIPYISPTDLIIFKINSCGLRSQGVKKRTDAVDAETLLARETLHSPLTLTSTQQAIVAPCIVDVVTHGRQSEQWWRQRLGLPTSN